MAFAIDAWWEERSERRLEKEMLINTLDSIRATESGILATYERMDLDDKNLRSFFDATEAELSSMPRESLRQILPALVRANTFDALAMLQTTDIGLIRDVDIRNAVNNWLATATELSQYNRQAESLSTRALLASGRHSVIQQLRFNGLESLDPEIDLVALRNDDELMAIVSALKATQSVQRRFFMSSIQDINEELQQLLVPLTE